MPYTVYSLGHRRQGDVVEVTLVGTEANVELLDPSGLAAFKAGRSHRYWGGHYTVSPVMIPIPHTGTWSAVVHLGGYAGSVRSSVRVLGQEAA